TLAATFSGPIACNSGAFGCLGFSVVDPVSGRQLRVYSTSVSTNTVYFSLLDAALPGETIQLSYQLGNLTPVAAFGAQPVTNTTPAGGPPDGSGSGCLIDCSPAPSATPELDSSTLFSVGLAVSAVYGLFRRRLRRR